MLRLRHFTAVRGSPLLRSIFIVLMLIASAAVLTHLTAARSPAAATPAKPIAAEIGRLEIPYQLQLSAEAAEGCKGDPAWLAIRPEKVTISHDPPPEGTINTVAGEVWDIGYLGDVSVYRVRLPNGSVIKATTANVTRVVERPIGWDDKVYLTWPRDAGLVLTS